MFVPNKNKASQATSKVTTAKNTGTNAVKNKVTAKTAKVRQVAEKVQDVAQLALGAASLLKQKPVFKPTPGINGSLPENGEFSPLPDIGLDTSLAMAASDLLGVIHAVDIQIIIGNAVYTHFRSFQLQQSCSEHHRFELVLAHDTFGVAEDHTLENARDFLGQSIQITFKYKNLLNLSPERSFKGIITQVGFTQEHGNLGNIVLTGQSPTALLDAAEHTQSFGGEQGISLQTLVQEVIQQGVNEQQMKTAIKCAYKGNLPYTCQYNETHYNYLARMAAAYGEWFFYDGEILNFGKPALPNPIKLIYGKDTQQVQLQMKAAHVNQEHYGYNSKNHQPLGTSLSELAGLGELGTHALDISKRLFKTRALQIAPVRAISDQDVETSQKGKSGANAASVFTLSGSTSVPFLYPGCLIEMNFKKTDSSEVRYFSRLLVTQVNHHLNIRGEYQCQFEAIPSDTPHLPQPTFTMPVTEPQIATIKDNSDNQGRVKVQFDWQQGNDTTDFIRVMTPDAGSSDAVNKNRGSVFIPEVGDQVMIDFQHHHPDRPYVLGSLFHGKIGEGGGGGNNIKSIKTRSGHTIELNDGGNGTHIIIKDPSGNTIHLDTVGKNITITAPETITLNANNIIFNAEQNITANAGENISQSAGMNIFDSAGVDIMQNAGDCFSQFAVNDLRIAATNISNIASENVDYQAKTIEKTAEKMNVNSTKESMTINSARTVEVKSAEKAKLF